MNLKKIDWNFDIGCTVTSVPDLKIYVMLRLKYSKLFKYCHGRKTYPCNENQIKNIKLFNSYTMEITKN